MSIGSMGLEASPESWSVSGRALGGFETHYMRLSEKMVDAVGTEIGLG
jgi:hypothetical protein